MSHVGLRSPRRLRRFLSPRSSYFYFMPPAFTLAVIQQAPCLFTFTLWRLYVLAALVIGLPHQLCQEDLVMAGVEKIESVE